MGRLALGRYGERVLRSWGEPFGDVRLNPLRPDVILDEPWYLHAYPDVARAGVPAWEHFVTFGDAEGRSPGPDFDPGFYRRTYLTPEATKPAHHYIATGRGLGYRGRPAALDADVSAAAMRAAITPLPYPFVLVGNDAQRAGAPILVLEIATDLVRRGFSPVFLLHRGGPLLEDYRAIGPTFILDEGWDVGGFGAALRPTVGVFGSTGWSAPVLAGLSHRGPQALLVYEMVDYLAEHSLLQAVAACRTVVAPMPGVRDELADRLSGTGTVEMITPGLRPLVATSHQRRGPQTPGGGMGTRCHRLPRGRLRGSAQGLRPLPGRRPRDRRGGAAGAVRLAGRAGSVGEDARGRGDSAGSAAGPAGLPDRRGGLVPRRTRVPAHLTTGSGTDDRDGRRATGHAVRRLRLRHRPARVR
jgi:hypothetical protein